MMRRRRIAWLTAACLALAACLTAWLWPPNSCPVKLANHRDIKGWMTLADVECVLGGPPGDYSSAPGQTRFRLNVQVNGPSATWISDEGIVIVAFDNGRVGAWHFVGPGVSEPRPIDRFRQFRTWLGW